VQGRHRHVREGNYHKSGISSGAAKQEVLAGHPGAQGQVAQCVARGQQDE